MRHLRLLATLIAILGVSAAACAQVGLPPPAPIGEWGVPFRAGVHLGRSSLSGGVGDYMNGALSLVGECAIPVSPRFAVEGMGTSMRWPDLKVPLNFPYTNGHTFAPLFAPAQGYLVTLGAGVRYEPRVQLQHITVPRSAWEPCVRAGLSRQWLGWEPRPETGGGASTDYRQHHKFASQSGWAPYLGAGLNWTRYGGSDFPALGMGVEVLHQRVSTSGDVLLPVGAEVSGGVTTFNLRLTFGTR